MSFRPRDTSWLEGPDQELAQELLSRLRQRREWPAHRRRAVYESVCASVVHARHRVQAVTAVLACAAAFCAGIWAASGVSRLDASASLAPTAAREPNADARLPSPPASGAFGEPRRWENLELGGVGLVEVLDGHYELHDLPGGWRLWLESGMVRAQIVRQDPMRPLVVATPQLRVVIAGTRFDVQVDAGRTRVEVIEGLVRVESGDRSVEVSAGEVIDSDDSRLRPAARAPSVALRVPPVPAPQATNGRTAARWEEEERRSLQSCERLEPRAREACLLGLARGDALVAQNAQFALGAFAANEQQDWDRAIEHWQAYLARFPTGPLGPEALLALFEALLIRGRTEDALVAAADFERRFAEDPRAPRVALARARLLCGLAGERALGRAILERLSVRTEEELRATAEALKAGCQGPSFGPAGPGGLVPRDLLPEPP